MLEDSLLRSQVKEPIILMVGPDPDILALYGDQFFEELKIGYHNVYGGGRISFAKTRFVVFSSRNPISLFNHLNELSELPNFCVNFIINDYENELFERFIPTLDERIDACIELSKKIGKNLITWKLDPLIQDERLTIGCLLERIQYIGDRLNGYVSGLSMSFAYKLQLIRTARYNKVHLWSESDILGFINKVVKLNAERGWNLDLSCSFKHHRSKMLSEKCRIREIKSYDLKKIIGIAKDDSNLVNCLLGISDEESSIYDTQLDTSLLDDAISKNKSFINDELIYWLFGGESCALMCSYCTGNYFKAISTYNKFLHGFKEHSISNLELCNDTKHCDYDDSSISACPSKKIITLMKEDRILPMEFSYCYSLINISIPFGVKKIGNGAFAYCTSLESVDVPNGVEYFGSGIFAGCNMLNTISLPDSLVSLGESLFFGLGAFAGCASITHIKLPEKLKSISADAFCGCTSLQDIIIPEYLEKIDSEAFYDCTSLETVVFNSKIRYIGKRAFGNCKSLKKIYLPESIEVIDAEAFIGCEGLQFIHLPAKMDWIGGRAFSDCLSLKDIDMPKSLLVLSPGLFNCCYSLNSIEIPNDTIEIGAYVFYNCRHLKKISTSVVRFIDDFAFTHCESLSVVNMNIDNMVLGANVFSSCKSLTCIKVKKGSKDYYLDIFSSSHNASFKNIIVEDVD